MFQSIPLVHTFQEGVFSYNTVYFAVIPSLLPGTRNFPYREDNKTGWGKEESNTFLNISSVTLLTIETYIIL